MPTRALISSILREDPTATCRSARASISAWATSSPALRPSARWRRSSSAGRTWSWPCRRTLFAGGGGLASGPSKSFLSRFTSPAIDLLFSGGRSGHVHFGSKADTCSATCHARFTPNSDIDSVFRHVCFGPKADIRRGGDKHLVFLVDWIGDAYCRRVDLRLTRRQHRAAALFTNLFRMILAWQSKHRERRYWRPWEAELYPGARVGLVQAGNLGDVVHTLPMAGAIKAACP